MRKKILIGIIICCFIGVSGCEPIKPTTTLEEGTYTTDTAMTAEEYSIYLSKEIAVAENVLSTRIIMAERVAAGKLEANKELDDAEESLSKVEAVVKELQITMPAQTYESDRTNTLTLLDEAKTALENYIEHLKNNDSDAISTDATDLKNSYLALAGNANAEYE